MINDKKEARGSGPANINKEILRAVRRARGMAPLNIVRDKRKRREKENIVSDYAATLSSASQMIQPLLLISHRTTLTGYATCSFITVPVTTPWGLLYPRGRHYNLSPQIDRRDEEIYAPDKEKGLALSSWRSLNVHPAIRCPARLTYTCDGNGPLTVNLASLYHFQQLFRLV
jgi:hypothetical protein